MKKQDCLERDKYVEKLLDVIRSCKSLKSNISFSINGEWGCGKTFVLEKLEDKLKEQKYKKNYIVFHYNCWEYDYYEEPLFPIVSVMMKAVKEIEDIAEDDKDKLIEILREVGLISLTLISVIKGIDLNDALKKIKDIKKGKDKINADSLFEFKEKIKMMRGLIERIAEKKTIIFIVDELDRCRPEYAIKVLERLHHMSYDIKNFITIIAIDKNSIIRSIKQVYGYEQDEADRFLKKFVHFSLKLGQGSLKECSKKYRSYINSFSNENENDFIQYLSILFEKIFKETQERNLVIRDQEIIFDKAYTIHKLSVRKNSPSYDYTVMYMELLLTTSYYSNKDNNLDFLKDAIDKVIQKMNLENNYEDDAGLKIIDHNIWHILKWYIVFLPLVDENGKLDSNIVDSDGLSIKTDRIIGIDLKINLEIIKSFSDNLEYFI